MKLLEWTPEAVELCAASVAATLKPEFHGSVPSPLKEAHFIEGWFLTPEARAFEIYLIRRGEYMVGAPASVEARCAEILRARARSCSVCGVQKSPYLDAYYGRDASEAAKCEACRSGRNYARCG